MLFEKAMLISSKISIDSEETKPKTQVTMPTNPWNCPFAGLGFFLTKPRLWGWALLATLLAGAATLFTCSFVLYTTWPKVYSHWSAVQSFGWALFAFVLMVAILFPLIFNACFVKALSRYAGKETPSFYQEFFASFWVFFRTLKWRILWPIFLLLCLFYVPILIFPLSLLAINHLAVIESVDLSLTLFGMSGPDRVRWIHNHGTDCFKAALSGSFLTLLLSFLFIGWIFWIPSIYCGTFLWLQEEN